jgi:phosphohistidine phosphatase
MNLYLMRHGLAVDRGTPGYDGDRERPLTSKGQRKVQRIAEALVGLDCAFEVILSSPLTRAHQTAEVVAEEVKNKPKVQLTEHLEPGAKPKELIALVQNLSGSPQDLLLVGHEPDLGQLASLLLTGGEELQVAFKKGGLAKLAVEKLRAGRCATLEWLLTPRQLELMTL